MKKTLPVWLITMTLSIVLNGAGQTAVASGSPQFTLTISADHRSVKAGANVTIQVALTNSSEKPMPLRAEIEDYGYMVDVTAVGYGAAPDTDRGRDWKRNGGERQTVSGPMALLKPGETTKGPLVISDLYDLSRPGKYWVQVRRGDVASNRISLTVVP